MNREILQQDLVSAWQSLVLEYVEALTNESPSDVEENYGLLVENELFKVSTQILDRLDKLFPKKE